MSSINEDFWWLVETDLTWQEPEPVLGNFEEDSYYFMYLNKYYNINFDTFCELMSIFYFVETKHTNYINIVVYFFKKNRLDSFKSVEIISMLNDRPFFKLYSKFKKINLKRILLPAKKKKVYESLSNITSNFLIRFSPTTIVKYLSTFDLNSYQILYLRKNKIFNKGRYSRNRQFYRTGVYWCLYINIIAILGLYFWFYRFVINFGYLWWLLYISILSFILAKAFNYNLLNPMSLLKSIYSDVYWFSYHLVNFFSLLFKSFYNYVLNQSKRRFIFLKFPKVVSVVMHLIYVLFRPFYNINYTNYLWGYNSVNYYIYSITIRYNRYVLDQKKYRFFSEFLNMYLKK